WAAFGGFPSLPSPVSDHRVSGGRTPSSAASPGAHIISRARRRRSDNGSGLGKRPFQAGAPAETGTLRDMSAKPAETAIPAEAAASPVDASRDLPVCVLAKVGEASLKGRNRRYFLDTLRQNLKAAL